MKKLSIIAVLLFSLSLTACKISFNGASIPVGMKTVTVRYFENNAPLVVQTLSQTFTEDLKTQIRTQTSLNIVQNDGQCIFEGRITGYDIRPVAIQNNNQPTAGATRLSITISAKFTNNLDPKKNFERSFERYKDFPLNGQSIQTKEPQLIKEVVKQLTEDIFNQAFTQW